MLVFLTLGTSSDSKDKKNMKWTEEENEVMYVQLSLLWTSCFVDLFLPLEYVLRAPSA